jgi:hypothetical protein
MDSFVDLCFFYYGNQGLFVVFLLGVCPFSGEGGGGTRSLAVKGNIEDQSSWRNGVGPFDPVCRTFPGGVK